MSDLFSQPLIGSFCQRPPALLFVDVDGVLLDFDHMLYNLIKEKKINIPAWQLWLDRSDVHLEKAFSGYITSARTWELCDEIFKSGQLKNQPGFPYLDARQMSPLLASDHVYILTKIPEFAVADRVECLNTLYKINSEDKVIAAWTETKGDIIKRICTERGLDLNRVGLIDDNPDFVESALIHGIPAILVEHKYNELIRPQLKARYPDIFASVAHARLPEMLEKIMVSK